MAPAFQVGSEKPRFAGHEFQQPTLNPEKVAAFLRALQQRQGPNSTEKKKKKKKEKNGKAMESAGNTGGEGYGGGGGGGRSGVAGGGIRRATVPEDYDEDAEAQAAILASYQESPI